ncbi:MAG: methyltransferase domain-containing protein, partial [Thermoanaerobaculia bacterium]|nr:methyltransferase domain-containing protein [Thermoanaerobaculia bacterium]
MSSFAERARAEERRIMNSWAPVYDRWVMSGSWLYHRYRRQFADWARSRLEAGGRDGSRLDVLDVGCGTGRLVGELAAWEARRVVGLDLSEGMLAVARRSGCSRLVLGLVEE